LGCRQVGKAQGFDPCMRGFESLHPSHFLISLGKTLWLN
jgi:hypothetical protein